MLLNGVRCELVKDVVDIWDTSTYAASVDTLLFSHQTIEHTTLDHSFVFDLTTLTITIVHLSCSPECKEYVPDWFSMCDITAGGHEKILQKSIIMKLIHKEYIPLFCLLVSLLSGVACDWETSTIWTPLRFASLFCWRAMRCLCRYSFFFSSDNRAYHPFPLCCF